MGSDSKKLYGAEGRGELLLFDPNTLTIVSDKKHPLYDERATMPVDERLVESIMKSGVLEPVIVRRNGEDEKGRPIVEVVDGRQRVRAAIIANHRIGEQGGERRRSVPWLAPSGVIAQRIDARVRDAPRPHLGPLLEVGHQQVDAPAAVLRDRQDARPIAIDLLDRRVRPWARDFVPVRQRRDVLPVAPEAVAVPVHEHRPSAGRQPLQALCQGLRVDGVTRPERSEVPGKPHHRHDVLARRGHRSPGRGPDGVLDRGPVHRRCRGPEQRDERDSDHLTPRT